MLSEKWCFVCLYSLWDRGFDISSSACMSESIFTCTLRIIQKSSFPFWVNFPTYRVVEGYCATGKIKDFLSFFRKMTSSDFDLRKRGEGEN